MKTNTSLWKRFSSRGWKGPRENSVGANWQTSKHADKSGTERPRSLRRTVLLSTTLWPSPFDLSIRPPLSSPPSSSRDRKKISPVNQLFSSYSFVAVLRGSVARTKSHHNQTERNRVTTKGNTAPSSSCLYGRICGNRTCYERFVCWVENRKRNGISVSGCWCSIHQNRSNLVVVVHGMGENSEDRNAFVWYVWKRTWKPTSLYLIMKISFSNARREGRQENRRNFGC